MRQNVKKTASFFPICPMFNYESYSYGFITVHFSYLILENGFMATDNEETPVFEICVLFCDCLIKQNRGLTLPHCLGMGYVRGGIMPP